MVALCLIDPLMTFFPQELQLAIEVLGWTLKLQACLWKGCPSVVSRAEKQSRDSRGADFALKHTGINLPDTYKLVFTLWGPKEQNRVVPV